MLTRIAGIRRMSALVLFVIGSASPAGAQSESLRSIASELAGTIKEASRQGVVCDPGVLVHDFAQTHGARTALEARLADRFSKALIATQVSGAFGTHLPAFHVIKAGEFPPSPDNDLKVDERECRDFKPGADFVVDGYIDVLADAIVLRILTTRASDKRSIFDKRVTLPLDLEMRSLLATPLPDVPAPTASAPISWVRPGSRVEDGRKAPQLDVVKG